MPLSILHLCKNRHLFHLLLLSTLLSCPTSPSFSFICTTVSITLHYRPFLVILLHVSRYPRIAHYKPQIVPQTHTPGTGPLPIQVSRKTAFWTCIYDAQSDAISDLHVHLSIWVTYARSDTILPRHVKIEKSGLSHHPQSLRHQLHQPSHGANLIMQESASGNLVFGFLLFQGNIAYGRFVSILNCASQWDFAN